MSNFKAVIFDLDGTLVDSVHDIAETMNGVLCELGCPGFATAEYRQWIGGGADAMVRRIAELRHVGDGEALLRTYLHRYGENVADRTRLFDGIDGVLRACREHGLSTALLSNKDAWMVQRLHRILFADAGFREVVGVSSAFARKPDPASSLHIARKLGVSPRECLFVGDTAVDLATARAAGMGFAAALWGYGARHELVTGATNLSFSRPADLETFIRSNDATGARRRLLATPVS